MHLETANISVIIPVYNTGPYLKMCIESLSDQKPLLEIIIVDDGSTDNSGVIADNYAQKDQRIKVIHQKNKGLAAARNKGIDVSTGEYVFFLDSDDWIKEKSLDYLYSQASMHQVDVIMGNAVYCYPNGQTGNPFGKINKDIVGSLLTGKQCFVELMKTSAYAPMACIYICRRDYLQNCQFRFESVIHEDELWTPFILGAAQKVVVTDYSFYCYRQARAESIMSKYDPIKRFHALFFIADRLINFAEIFSFEGDDMYFKSWLYVTVFRLYSQAFELLGRIKDSSFILPQNHLACWDRIRQHLPEIAQNRIAIYYTKSRKLIKDYEEWLSSELVIVMQQINLDKKTIILIYNTLWGKELAIPTEELPINVVITTDRRYFMQAKVVVFHLPDLFRRINGDIDKKDGQLWVAWYLESDKNYPWIKKPEISSFFDLTMSYRQDADVVYPYYSYDYEKKLMQTISTRNRFNKTCMFISSRINLSGRIEYLSELIQYTAIDSFGRLYNNKVLLEDKGAITKMTEYNRYKFVIAFENAIDTDYVTEKFFDPLLAGAVPIYLGAPNIDEFAPGNNCFVDVRQFSNPKELACFINQCYVDEQLYAQFFEWKNQPIRDIFLQKTMIQKTNPFARLCDISLTPQKITPSKIKK